MKTKIIALSLLLTIGLFNTSCDPEDIKPVLGVNCVGNQCLNLETFVAGIESRLDGMCTKYAYHVRSGLVKFDKAVGPARTAADPPAKSFNLDQRFNPASVTKTVTAVALLRALEQNNIGIHSSIAPYFPDSWKVHNSIQGITFQEVLSHTSGFRNSVAGAYDHNGVRTTIEVGIKPADKIEKYQNINYAVARVLLAEVVGYSTGFLNPEPIAISNRFIQYLQDEIFDPVGIQNVDFTPIPGSALFYPFPAGKSNGVTYGDWYLREGSAGIQLSMNEMAEFLLRMWTPGTYLSANMLSQVKTYEMGVGEYVSPNGTPDGIGYGKGGYFPASYNQGAELNSVIVRFGSGVQAVVVVNGPISAKSVVLQAYEDAWETK